jgi:uncharacterized membrane protein YeaQ/YmgE (transglycosylase-associated protein family)
MAAFPPTDLIVISLAGVAAAAALIYIKGAVRQSRTGCRLSRMPVQESSEMSILWTIIIGFIVGVIAKFIMPGDKTEPKGFILTAVLGIVGAFVATYLGQAVGWYKPGESAGFFGAIVGAIVLLFVYGLIMGRQGRSV